MFFFFKDAYSSSDSIFVVFFFTLSIYSIRELSDTIMNVVGAFLWVSVGATALHYWSGYMTDHDQLVVVHERTVSKSVIHFITQYDSFYITRLVIFFSGRFGAWITMHSTRSSICGRQCTGIHSFCKIILRSFR